MLTLAVISELLTQPSVPFARRILAQLLLALRPKSVTVLPLRGDGDDAVGHAGARAHIQRASGDQSRSRYGGSRSDGQTANAHVWRNERRVDPAFCIVTKPNFCPGAVAIAAKERHHIALIYHGYYIISDSGAATNVERPTVDCGGRPSWRCGRRRGCSWDRG